MKAKLSSSPSSKGLDKIDVNVVLSKIMLNWFGIDRILYVVEYTRENMIRYDNMRDAWKKGVKYEFNEYRRYVTTNPIEALSWIERGVALVRVDGKRQCEWEEEYGIERER